MLKPMTVSLLGCWWRYGDSGDPGRRPGRLSRQWCQSRRGAAINQLLTLQLRQEAYKVEQGQFSTSLAALGPASDEHYDYALNTTATGYLLTAYAKAASPQRSDQGCQRLTLDVDAQR